MKKEITAAAVQFQHRANDKEYNFSRIEHFVDTAKKRSVDVIAFPEMCITGYWHVPKLTRGKIEALAEPIPDGESTQKLVQLSERNGMIIGAGLIERSDDGKFFNSYAVAMPDGQVQRHRKIQAFESEHISAGNEYTVFGTPMDVDMGVLICYDNNIIENTRMTALKGADILLAPHQTGGTNSVSPHGMKPIDPELWDNREQDPQSIEAEFRGPNGREWLMRWLPSRAHDNGMFIIFSNGVGWDDGEVRTGNAMLIDPYGRIIEETWKAGDEIVTAKLDMDLLENCTGKRWMKARRPGLYTPLAQPTGNEQDTRRVRLGKT